MKEFRFVIAPRCVTNFATRTHKGIRFKNADLRQSISSKMPPNPMYTKWANEIQPCVGVLNSLSNKNSLRYIEEIAGHFNFSIQFSFPT